MAPGAASPAPGPPHADGERTGRTPDVNRSVNGTCAHAATQGGTQQHERRANRLVRGDLAGRARTTRDHPRGVVVPKVGGSSPLGHPTPDQRFRVYLLPSARAPGGTGR